MFLCAAKMDGSAVYTGTKSVFIHDEFTTKNRWPRALLFVNSPRGGDSYMEQTGMLVGNFEFNP